MTAPSRTLPIRGWFVLALVALLFIPHLVIAAVAPTQARGSWQTLPAAAQVLRDGAPRWDEPAWRAATRSELASRGVDFVLFENGNEVYRSTADPLAGTDENNPRLAQTLVVDGTQKIAHIYADESPTGGASWLVPLGGSVPLLLVLGATAWFLGNAVLKPLSATSRAVRRVAEGDFEIELPESRVREVAELNAAFVAMSAELRASLQRQAELEEERRFFVGAIAHDLRTPLFSLRGYLEGMEQGLATTPEKRAKYLGVCREKADMLERLISDLFDYAKIEYLGQTLYREPLEFGELLWRTVEGLRARAESKCVALALDGPPETSCTLEGDEHLLRRAVQNLVENALRYTPAGGKVEVSWRSEPDRATFVVADTGPGIATQDLPRVFDPLYRAETSRNRQTGGAGLGLAIARRILRAHGGDLRAANRKTGGAQFIGSLSLGPRTPPMSQTVSSEGRAQS
jgi:signal transduction histidine kinase